MSKTFYLSPPRFDGAAGARHQTVREVSSFWCWGRIVARQRPLTDLDASALDAEVPGLAYGNQSLANSRLKNAFNHESGAFVRQR